jgi:hypothetical protein
MMTTEEWNDKPTGNNGDKTNPDDLIRRGDALDAAVRFDGGTHTKIASRIAALPAVAASQPADPVVKADSRQRVTVKPLLWKMDEDGNYRAQSIRGSEGVDRMIEPQVIGDDRVFYEAWGIEAEFDAPEAAQAAIEAEIASEILAAIDAQPDPRDAQRRDLEKVIRNQRAELKRLQSVEKAHWAYVNRVINERKSATRDAQIAALVDAADAQLQYMDMCGDKGDLERNLRAAIAAVKGGAA